MNIRFSISLFCCIPVLAFSPISHSEKSLFSAATSEQKQWVGKPAPAFKLQDQSGKWHELKQYAGKWVVLYFYPKDNSPGCTQEANQFKALYPQFIKNNAVVLGVSLDDVASHQKFSEKLALPFPILADQNHQLANQMGVVRNLGIAKIAKRETFLIDPQGHIIYHYSSVDTQTHANQVLADVLKYSKSLGSKSLASKPQSSK
ncbi:peroxiredoxin [Acinetobacter shaoyimingii]|uniref:thioredoxin-dependent peroxiredoxin n=1 Tax=Acinetobacter shaoyimingii TaxID=2715164 RepID=A0A6G8RXV3_9GAMM|nr:peroxiredoxin [Acinetobacter shaoyimingii]QIO06759.1 peroxiredoxin [Acinetobacter shaoyimingii]